MRSIVKIVFEGTSTPARATRLSSRRTSTETYISALSSLSGLSTTPRTLTVRVAGSSEGPMLTTVPSKTLPGKAFEPMRILCPGWISARSVSAASTWIQSLVGSLTTKSGAKRFVALASIWSERTSWPGLMFFSTTIPASGDRRTYVMPVAVSLP